MHEIVNRRHERPEDRPDDGHEAQHEGRQSDAPPVLSADRSHGEDRRPDERPGVTPASHPEERLHPIAAGLAVGAPLAGRKGKEVVVVGDAKESLEPSGPAVVAVPDESAGERSGAERSAGFRATSTVFWIPGISQARGRMTVAERLAGLPAETSPEAPSTIVVRDAAPSSRPEARDRPRREPYRVGAYEVAARLAQGGMGSVYLCRRAGGPGFRRLYALKVVRQHADEKEAAKAFQREAFLGAYLDHPNLQRVIEVGSYEQQPFLVLDYVEGASLADLVLEGEKPPVRAVVSVLLDVLRGLHYAHVASDERGGPLGIVHGDISLSNVLVGVDGCARVTDFGCASLARERREGGASQVARFGGRPAFTAPEILCGEGADARSDVFSVGVMMWQLLTGQKLFAAESYDQTVMAVLRKRVSPPSVLGAPACLDDVCLRACVRAREGRFTSAAEMAEDLARIAAAHGLLGGTDEVGAWVRREWGERLAERRRWAEEAFAPPVSPLIAANNEATSDSKRVPSKTVQLASVASGSPAHDVEALVRQSRWRRRPAADDEENPKVSRASPDEASPAKSPDEWNEEEATLIGGWWKQPWIVVGVSAALAFAATLGVARWLERPANPPDERADLAGTTSP